MDGFADGFGPKGTTDAASFAGIFRPGLFGSLVLHALAAFFLLYRIGVPEAASPVVPVEVVRLAEETGAQPAAGTALQQRQAALQQQARPPARRDPLNPNPPARAAPSENRAPPSDVETPPTDELQAKLEALAKLRQPGIDTGTGDADTNAAGNGRAQGIVGSYSVQDYIRAQVERRWNLKLDELGERNIVVTIRLVLKRDGSVESVEIVNEKRQGADAVARSIALSARNAVILSSPFLLPAGDYAETMDVTLNLNPRDILR